MKVIAGFLAGALLVGGFFVLNSSKDAPEEAFGAFGSPEVFVRTTFFNGLAQGGVFTIATTTTALTLTNAQISDASVISVTAMGAGQAALALTLPASSTWSSLPKNGTVQSWIIDNVSTAAGTTTTITAGTGVDIDGTTANDDVINGGVSGKLSCWKLPIGDIRCIVEEMVDAG